MPEYENNPGDILVFRNDKATGKQPQYRVKWWNAAGEECSGGLWIRESSKDGSKFFSGKLDLQPWQGNQQQGSESTPPEQDPFPATAPDDEVPF